MPAKKKMTAKKKMPMKAGHMMTDAQMKKMHKKGMK